MCIGVTDEGLRCRLLDTNPSYSLWMCPFITGTHRLGNNISWDRKERMAKFAWCLFKMDSPSNYFVSEHHQPARIL